MTVHAGGDTGTVGPRPRPRPRRGGRSRVRTALGLAALVVVGLLLTSCAPGMNDAAGTAAIGTDAVAGFWQGLWHGVISPITFLISLFNESVGIYEIHNNGGWYDFGFMIGVSIFFGGGAGGSRAGRSRKG